MGLRHLILPGLGGSGPDHWQSRWETLLGDVRRVEQAHWDNPTLSDWQQSLERSVAQCPDGAVLIAHSLACVLVAHWAQSSALTGHVRAALLVAPADVDTVAAHIEEVRDFTPIPLAPLPFKALIVASANDPFAQMERARHLAQCWKARLVDVGNLGHINSESNLGDWPQGQRLLKELLAS